MIDIKALFVAETVNVAMSNHPHPLGYLVTKAVLFRRGLYAYEWAKQHEGASLEEATKAVIAWEEGRL